MEGAGEAGAKAVAAEEVAVAGEGAREARAKAVAAEEVAEEVALALS